MSNERLSRFLARVLRHDAKRRHLQVTSEGYVNVCDILELSEVNDYDEDDVRNVCKNDRKGRFKLKTDPFTRKLQIKATQGHSFKLDEPELTQIQHVSDVRAVLHGTRSGNWESIKLSGLSKKNRTHIHFAEGEGVQSGFPPYCDMVIEIDLKRALQDGIRFYKSENDVILSEGNDNGYIPKKYFRRAYYRHSGKQLEI